MADAKPKRQRETLAERAARRRERRRGWRTQDAVSTSSDRCMGKKATTVFLGINVAFVVRRGLVMRVAHTNLNRCPCLCAP